MVSNPFGLGAEACMREGSAACRPTAEHSTDQLVRGLGRERRFEPRDPGLVSLSARLQGLEVLVHLGRPDRRAGREGVEDGGRRSNNCRGRQQATDQQKFLHVSPTPKLRCSTSRSHPRWPLWRRWPATPPQLVSKRTSASRTAVRAKVIDGSRWLRSRLEVSRPGSHSRPSRSEKRGCSVRHQPAAASLIRSECRVRCEHCAAVNYRQRPRHHRCLVLSMAKK
jgi:hypothetical protein